MNNFIYKKLVKPVNKHKIIFYNFFLHQIHNNEMEIFKYNEKKKR